LIPDHSGRPGRDREKKKAASPAGLIETQFFTHSKKKKKN
jgi:hypothetical protein